ncbi:hypothetical protein C8F04DRAFT_1138511 [Mycena alexandri]|uniref:Uncharacterized protein n=1 Tax=Mycena alexandri TaxID=1745969 RepID=A0AAD6WPI7_9AGAR|nr:hypothetical protein C8F04DRAFT_1138511 [Mycena alexandri]
MLGLLTAFFVPGVASVDCYSRFNKLQGMSRILAGETDSEGNAVTSIGVATGMTLDLCLQTCGRGIWDNPERWLDFCEKFSTWLLPFLALVSQLPFGGDTPFENVMSILLNVGSPTLAAYSVTLTTLNSRWIHRRFSRISYPSAQSAARVLDNLQQSRLQVTEDDYVLSSLIVLPENDQYWAELLIFLDVKHSYTWSFSNIASIIWVAMAFLLTVIQTFLDNRESIDSNGIAVGFAWLWLLAIVTCSLNAAPRCDITLLGNAIERANQKLSLAKYMDQPESLDLTIQQPAISLDAEGGGSITSDERRTAPIYNYARMVPWSLSAGRMYAAFSAASYRAEHNIPVSAEIPWEQGTGQRVNPANRRGRRDQVAAYIQRPSDQLAEIAGGGSRSLHASLMALLLTSGTLGSAMLMDWYTPTIGLSCRSGTYMIYSLNSVLVWSMLMTANHLTTSIVSLEGKTGHRRFPYSASSAMLLWRAAKILACMNTIWIVSTCALGFAGVYENCWCNSAVLTQGPRAYIAMYFTQQDWWKPLVGITAFASLSVGGFVWFNIGLNPSAAK